MKNINKNNPFAKDKGIKQKRSTLIGLSAKAKPVAKMTGVKINDVVLSMLKSEDHKIFHTFNDWKKDGFIVKKGAKAFCIWSKPIKPKDNEIVDDDYQFFGICHLFSNYQVDKLQ